uniref:BTB domain-containing protein n=1 Tax=Leersia perrieri TaxID=77586 RepID=A0A0D9W536_9ORYZ
MSTASASTVSKLLMSASTIVSNTESGQHLLKIDGYSRIKDAITTGNHVQSSSFSVGGYSWCIYYYPNGVSSSVSDYISVRLVLVTYVNQSVRAQFMLSLLNQDGEAVPSYTYNYGVQSFSRYSSWELGPWRFIQKAVLERSDYLADNCFSIRCDVTVFKDVGNISPTPSPSPLVLVPPSDLIRHLGGLLATVEGADVVFEVDGKTFLAHRNVLAARSPVFRAELFGSAGKENNSVAATICVDDMEAHDFGALLHFMYTDSLPEMKGGEAVAMLPDLIAAADKYKMERLRLVCEDKLCEYVNVRTAAAMLAFAEEHQCHGLKKKCLQLLDDPAILRKIVETEGLDYLTKSYPSVLKDLIAKFATKVCATRIKDIKREENTLIGLPMSITGGTPRPPLRSASTVIAGTESGQHLLKIEGYSRIKEEFPNGKEIKSRSFHVGGHSWHISYYPSGYNSDNANCVSIFLQLDRKVEKGVKANYSFSLLDRAGRPSYTLRSGEPSIFIDIGWGWRCLIEKDKLEKLDCLWDDCFTIMCDFNVFKELRTEDIDIIAATPPPLPPPPPPTIMVPPSDLHRHLGGLLTTEEGADVMFEVDGKTFKSHKWVLAARSPMFREKLFDPKKEIAATSGAVDVIHINNIEAQDFVALLCYMYTDSLPEMKGEETVEMLPDLVAAANRYKIDRLRLLCEHRLCEYVNERTVVAMLAFAGENHCDGLKKKCLCFLDDPIKLREVMKAEGLEHLSKNYPSILKDLIAKLADAPTYLWQQNTSDHEYIIKGT